MPRTPEESCTRRGTRCRLAWPILGLLLGCAAPTTRDTAGPNDNRLPAGALRDGVLHLDLELRAARWQPEGREGPSLPVHVFGEAGAIPTVPGPLIRVPAGSEVRLTVHNTLPDSTLVLHGVESRPGAVGDSVVVRPGARQEVRFTAGAPGTYFYWGSTTHSNLETRLWLDSQLNGAIVVDSVGSTGNDRVFVLGIWSNFPDRPGPYDPDTGEVMTINGLAWPHTEHFDLPVGDSVDWRWVNPSASSHPMHLHGVFFELQRRGDQSVDTAYGPGQRPLEVTELMLTGGTMAMRWAPARAGNWVFHCHFAFHVSPFVSMDYRPRMTHHRMAGLVLGINAIGPVPDTTTKPERRMRLLVQQAPNRLHGQPGYGYVLQSGASPPATDSIEIPGPPLVLTRGEPVAITVVNHLAEPTSVHWHGMELESYPDGVPNWSGGTPTIFRPIQPGDSFTAHFTPPRAGTYIYHSHDNDLEQMPRGLYGALLVLEPGARYDPETDRVIIVGGNGTFGVVDTLKSLVNGREHPDPLALRPGRPVRLRLISIDVDHRILFRLFRGDSVAEWLPLAKDGADLPSALAVRRTATLLTGPGETADFQVTTTGDTPWRLQISAPYVDDPWTIPLPLPPR